MKKIFSGSVLICLLIGSIACKSSSPTTPAPPIKNPPVVNSFEANPDSINYRESTTLSWSVSNATKVEIDHEIGQVDLTGTKEVGPLSESVTYTLTATNNDGITTKTCFVEVKAGAYFELVSTKKGYKSYGCCYISGKVKNKGNATGYNVMITFQAYDSSNTIIDTAHGFPASLGDIPPGISATFEAIFFDTYDWNKIAKLTYIIEWLNREGMRCTQEGLFIEY